MPGEKRSSERKKLGVAISLNFRGNHGVDASSLAAITTDISSSGLSFETKTLYPLGTEIEALITIPGRVKPISSVLQIVRVESDSAMKHFRIGTTYKEIDTKDRVFLSQSLDKINLRALLDTMLRMGATDMHLTVGHPPAVRKNNVLETLEFPPIEDGQVQAMIYPLMNEKRRRLFEKNLEMDFAFSLSANERFRINLHWQKEHMEAAIRNVSSIYKTFEELLLPNIALERLCRERAGLILITGRAGSGKTTTLASMIQYINANYAKVIITIEDPVEFMFANEKDRKSTRLNSSH